VAEQALGLSESAHAMLAMCKVPRPDHRDADLAAVSGRVGLTVEALADLLRQAEAVPLQDRNSMSASPHRAGG
jgi:hypothetical protein